MEKAEMHIKKEQEWLMDSLRALGLDGHHHLAKEELNQSGGGGGGGRSSGNGHNGLNSSLQFTTQSAE